MVRQSALKLAAFLSVKLPFHVVAPNFADMLETTYQFHEHCLKVASLSLLNMLDECQSSLALRSRIASYDEYVTSYARYACSLLDHSSMKISKKSEHLQKPAEDSDSSDALLDSIDGLFNAHDSAIDLMALSALALATVDAWKAAAGAYELHAIRKVSAGAILHNLLEIIESLDLHKNAQMEILHRMKNFSFPSLSDDIMDEIAAELIKELLAASNASSTNHNTVESIKVPNVPIRISSRSQDKLGTSLRDEKGAELVLINENITSSRPASSSDKLRRQATNEKLLISTDFDKELRSNSEQQKSISRLSRHPSRESLVQSTSKLQLSENKNFDIINKG